MHTTTTRPLLAALLLLAAATTLPACFTEVPEAPACVSDGTVLPGDMTRTNHCCDPDLKTLKEGINVKCSELYEKALEGSFGKISLADTGITINDGLLSCSETDELKTTESGLCQISPDLNLSCLDADRDCSGEIKKCIYVSRQSSGAFRDKNTALSEGFTAQCNPEMGCTVCAECSRLVTLNRDTEELEEQVDGCAEGFVCTLPQGVDSKDDLDTPASLEGYKPELQRPSYGFCRPDNTAPPLKAQGEPCATPEECKSALTCFGSDNAKTCEDPCTLDTQEAVCGELICNCGDAEASLACNPAANCKPGAQCPSPQPSGSACFACDPTLPNPCNPTGLPAVTRGCYPTEAGSAACLPEGTLSRGQACTQPNDCKHGSTCVEVDGQRTCQVLCTPADPWQCTVPGQQCVQAGAHNICDCNPAGENQCAGTLSACMASPQGDRGFCQPPP